ncbi:Uncharacterized protein QTN25_007167 [Entamoeba marina]
MPKTGKTSSTSKKSNKAKDQKKPSKVAMTREAIRKEAQYLDHNTEALKLLGYAGDNGKDVTNLTKREKKKIQAKNKRNKTVPKHK